MTSSDARRRSAGVFDVEPAAKLLAGRRIALPHEFVSAAETLRAAGAVIADASAQPSAVAEFDVLIAVDSLSRAEVAAARAGVGAITPTLGIFGETPLPLTFFAHDLHLANAAAALLGAGAPVGTWPADVRLAAPTTPTVALPRALPSLNRQQLDGFGDAIRRRLEDRATIITVDVAEPNPATARRRDTGSAGVFGGADALLLPRSGIGAQPGEPWDVCSVEVPAMGDAPIGVTVLAGPFGDAVAFDIAALVTGEPTPPAPWPLASAGHTELVVFGAHLVGGPLVHQLTDRGARFAGEITTAPRYRMTVLPTSPAKPGVTRVAGAAGCALRGHRWLLSPAALGSFLAELPAPMQLGKVEFDDGSWRTAFGCDGSVEGVDVSHYGSWPAAVAAGAVPQT